MTQSDHSDSNPVAGDTDSASLPACNKSDKKIRRVIVCAIVLAVVAGLVHFRKDIKYRFVVKNWGEVIPGRVFRSGQISKWLLEDQLKQHEIDVVIDMQTLNPEDPHQQSEIACTERLEIPLLRFPLGGDGTGPVTSYIDALTALQERYEAGENILLHCHAGADRTGGVFYCYRTLIQQRTPVEAMSEMEEYGWHPREGNPLIPYLRENLPVIAEALLERGIIEQMPQPIPHLPVED